MGLLLDFRYALRNIAKSMRFTLLMMFIIVGSLTISLIGFNYIYTVAFSHSNFDTGSQALRILKVKNPINMTNHITYKQIAPLKELAVIQELENWIYISPASVWVSDKEYGDHYRASYVDKQFFNFLDVTPALGRFYTDADFESSAPDVVVISYFLWQKLFHGDEGVLGKRMIVGQHAFEIIGVMPKRNNFPIFSKLWIPLKENKIAPDDAINILYTPPNQEFEARLEQRLGLFLTQLTKQTVSQSDQTIDRAVWVESMTLAEYNTDGEAVFIFTLFLIGIILILLISSINIGNLLFAKIVERQKESAIRAAIGAKKLRVVQQHACEGFVYCFSSWVFALLLTDLGLAALNFMMNSMFDGKMPYWWYWELNMTTINVSILLITLVFIVAVLIPAIKTANFNISNVLRDGTRGATGKQTALISKRLLSLQVTLVSFLLMAASTIGYVMHSFTDSIDGEALKGLYSSALSFQNQDDFSQEEAIKVGNAIVTGLSNEGVLQEGRVYHRELDFNVLTLNGQQYTDQSINVESTTHLFERELKLGRNFNTQDNMESEPVVIISESLAVSLFGRTDVLGEPLNLRGASIAKAKIIGLSVDEKSGLSSDSRHEVYVSFRQHPPKDNSFAMKFISSSPTSQSYEAFYRILSRLSVELVSVSIFDHYENHQSMIGAFTSIIYVFLLVGGFALTLSLIGVYAMGLSNINKSRYEIGIRRALGSKDNQIMMLFIKKNMTHTLYGLSISAAVFYILCYLATDFFRGHIPFSIMVGAGTVTMAMVIIAVGVALYVPVKRSLKVQPAVSLRMD